MNLVLYNLLGDLDRRFPLAPSPLSGDRVDDCIVCREPMESGRVLPCGHIMHSRCLLSWLELSQTCPICRVSVITELNDPQPGQNPARHPPVMVPGNVPYPPPEWNNAPQPFNYQPYQQHIPVNNNNMGIPQPGLQPPIEPNEPRETVPTVESPIPFTLPSQASAEPVPQPNDLSRIEAHVELMQEQLSILQEQCSVLLSDLRNYKRLHGVPRTQLPPPGSDNNNSKEDSRIEPERGSVSPKPLSSPPSEPSTNFEKPTPTTPPEPLDPEREEIRKRRLLRFSSEHTLTRPEN